MTLVLDEDGRLPAGDPHPATLSEIYDTFVRQAPFRPRRERIYTCLELFTEQVWRLSSGAVLWLDGGFTTHKTWAAPKDADVVALIPLDELSPFRSIDRLPLRTLQNVVINKEVEAERVQSYGGLLDTFIVPDTSAMREYWDDQWSSVKDPIGNLLPGTVRKGFVEVTRG